MIMTARGILLNFLHQIEEFGHIPNGTREYYIRRSQPPFLISMFEKYMEKDFDSTFLREHIGTLEKELQFFEKRRCLKYKWRNGKEYTVFRYFADCRGPRPESYSEDVEIAEHHFHTKDERGEFYLHMKAAAESGWDFSSRWFIDEDGGNTGTLSNAKTAYILPVDLNALMFKNYETMGRFWSFLCCEEKVLEYKVKAANMLKSLSELFWDPREGMWFDIDILNNKRRKFFYASNLFPLWTEAYPNGLTKNTVGKYAVDYLLRTGVTTHLGGIPASVMQTGQQWDWNAWPPLQHLIVSGLNKTGNLEAKKLAFDIARRYTLSTIDSCNKSIGKCEIFEKYDPTVPGQAGGGGEYEVQLGFGWTNGVLIDFISKYGDNLIERDNYEAY